MSDDDSKPAIPGQQAVPEPSTDDLPKAFAGCKCACHTHEFRHLRHVLPCCGPSWTRKPKGNEL